MGSKPRRKKQRTAATKPRTLILSGNSSQAPVLAASATGELLPASDERVPAVELPYLVDPPEAARLDVVQDEIAEPSAGEPEADRAESNGTSVELPFIVDPETPPDDVIAIVASEPRPEPEPWVDLVLEPTPRKPRTADEWVDQVLEPTKLPLPPRPSRARIAAAKSAKTAKSAKSTVPKTFAKGAAALATAVAVPATEVAAVPAAKAASTKAASTKAASAKAEPSAGSTRWWLVTPVFLLLVIVLYLNRPGRPHAPVPAGAIGQWTTAFWLYEHQMLEIKPDTVVVTLDEPEEGRYPITKVETSDAGRETAVKITYRLNSGDEKVLDFLADRDPTTALRFRAHSGLVWTRAQE